MKNRIKKFGVFALFCFLTVAVSNTQAQTVYKSSGSKSKSKNKGGGKFDKHKLVVGGNFGFAGEQVDANTTFSFFSITPLVGYQVADFNYTGLSMGYQYSRYKFRDYYNFVTGEQYTYKLVLPTYYIGAWNHLFVIPQAFINTELLYTFFKYADGTLNLESGEYERYNESAPSVIIGAGYANRQGPDTKVWYSFWLNYDLLQHPNSPYYSDGDFIAGLFYKAGFFVRL